jgi:hypothetical protein
VFEIGRSERVECRGRGDRSSGWPALNWRIFE